MRLFRNSSRKERVLVIGLDCAGPQLVFDDLREHLPNLSQLMNSGTWGELESSIPCITVPAWASMLSGRDPGVLGVYGFRNRRDTGYGPMGTADSSMIRVPRVWDYLSEAGRDSVVIGVPPTYPVQPIRGHLVSGILTPNSGSLFTYPAIFKQEVLNIAPDYAFDVRGFRTHDKAALLEQIIAMTEAQHRVVMYSLKTKPWDLFAYVNIGIDRIHHGFWRYHDPQHRLHDPNSPFNDAICNYYRLVDDHVGKMLEAAGGATVLVVSDHGVRRLDGCICMNEWLWRNGWLALRTPPNGHLISPEEADIDWSKTRAWASGGYYSRIFLNVQGREPQGVIPASAYEAVRDELAAELAAIPDPDGSPLDTKVFRPQDVYTQINGIAPDLLVYFGNLHWRAVGSLGHGAIHTLDNDTGPDDANHAEHGLFILHDPHDRGAGRIDGHQLMDVAPTVMSRLGLKIPAEIQGRIIGV